MGADVPGNLRPCRGKVDSIKKKQRDEVRKRTSHQTLAGFAFQMLGRAKKTFCLHLSDEEKKEIRRILGRRAEKRPKAFVNSKERGAPYCFLPPINTSSAPAASERYFCPAGLPRTIRYDICVGIRLLRFLRRSGHRRWEERRRGKLFTTTGKKTTTILQGFLFLLAGKAGLVPFRQNFIQLFFFYLYISKRITIWQQQESVGNGAGGR